MVADRDPFFIFIFKDPLLRCSPSVVASRKIQAGWDFSVACTVYTYIAVYHFRRRLNYIGFSILVHGTVISGGELSHANDLFLFGISVHIN